MSIVSYNGITLPYAYTTDFSQSSVYDDSGTDRIATLFDIKVQCLINREYLQLLSDDLFGELGTLKADNPAEIMKEVRNRLLRQRKSLSYKVNGVELIPFKQASSNDSLNTIIGELDAMNGPQPQSCVINMLTDTTFLLTYHVTARYWENRKIVDPDGGRQLINNLGNNVLTNRWSETVEFDDCMFSTRIREGLFRIRSDNAGGKQADDLRSDMAVLSIPAGFLRESSKYAVSPDGLSLMYTITDKEIYVMPPVPAFRAKGNYRESAVHMGAVRIGECSVALRGSKSTSQTDMVKVGIVLCIKKMRARQLQLTNSRLGIILQAVVVDIGLFDNTVDVMIRGILKQRKKRVSIAAGFENFNTVTPETHVNRRPKYFDRGTASLLIQAASYYDPNAADNKLGTGTLTARNEETPYGDSKYQMTRGKKIGIEGQEGDAGA